MIIDYYDDDYNDNNYEDNNDNDYGDNNDNGGDDDYMMAQQSACGSTCNNSARGCQLFLF